MKKYTAVAIDGPAGAGKSTLARELAKSLQYIYVDTGALYRAIGFYVIGQGIGPSDEPAVTALLGKIELSLAYVSGQQRVILCGEDVSDRIRTPEVSMAASEISAWPKVRAFLLSLQRDMAKHNNVVMDGRDIGTVVLPDAKVKIFLTASPEERAKRRFDEMIQKGMAADYEEVLSDLKKRDYNDSHREIAPLKPAQDSVVIDTTGNTLAQSIAMLKSTVQRLRS